MPEEVLIMTEDVRVRVLSLQPKEVLSRHFHHEVTDNMFCLSGEITIRLSDPEEEVVLQPGGRCEVRPQRRHSVANTGSGAARYLLVQGVGKYDFNVS